MTDYLHHVPGRLRIRSKVFRCDTVSRNMALRKLRAMEGVTSVRLNQKAASVTVCYDTDLTGPEVITGFLEQCECMPSSSRVATASAKKPQSLKRSDWNVGKEVGKIAFNVLVSRGVTSLIARI